MLYVVKTVVTYLYEHKWAVITADQKGYVLVKNNMFFNILSSVVKIIVLKVYQSFAIYLFVELIVFMLQSMFNVIVVNKQYPYLKTRRKINIQLETKKGINDNIKAMFVYKVGTYFVYGSDQILTTLFCGLAKAGIFTNYTLLTTNFNLLLDTMINGLGASVGNLICSDDTSKRYFIFNVIYFINFILYSLVTIVLYNVSENFIEWWLGKSYLLEHMILILLLFNFYIVGLRQAVLLFKLKGGIFTEDKYSPFFEGVIKLAISLFFGKSFGIIGILVATSISTLVLPFWNQPRLVYQQLFNQPLSTYFVKYVFYGLLTIALCFITSYMNRYVVVSSMFVQLVLKTVICAMISIISYCVIFFKSEEFQYVYTIIIKKLGVK